MSLFRVATVLSVAALAGFAFAVETATPAPRTATVPFQLDHNRMLVELEFVRPDGTLRTARAWVDTGNPKLVLGEALAHDLGVSFPDSRDRAEADEVADVRPVPRVRLAGFALEAEGIRVEARRARFPFAGVPAEANLPATLLRHVVAVLDYPGRRLTVARPGAARPAGVPVPCRVNDASGLFQVAATVGGRSVELGVDNGSSSTWVSSGLTEAWAADHPDWPHATGAVGTTNFFGFPFEARGTLMRVPELELGGVTARNVALLGLDPRLFEWYSQKSAGTVAGFIGANVLRGFRVGIDLPGRMTYWQAGDPGDDRDLDTVGVTVRPEGDGSFTVAGVAVRGGAATVEGVLPGDRLLRVGGLDTAGATMGAVAGALHGVPGERRRLVVEREGQRLSVEATVYRFP